MSDEKSVLSNSDVLTDSVGRKWFLVPLAMVWFVRSESGRTYGPWYTKEEAENWLGKDGKWIGNP